MIDPPHIDPDNMVAITDALLRWIDPAAAQPAPLKDVAIIRPDIEIAEPDTPDIGYYGTDGQWHSATTCEPVSIRGWYPLPLLPLED